MERYFTRIFIAITVIVIVAIYYLSEIVPFHYDGYENDVNRLQRHDAELDEAMVNTRFGIFKNYQPIVDAVDNAYQVIYALKDMTQKYPNPSIDDKLHKLEKAFDKKVQLTESFKRTNPLLLNAIASFSAVMGHIIESESHLEFIENCFDEVYRYQLMDKVNILYRGILLYTIAPSEEKNQELRDLITEIEEFPEELARLDIATMYAKKILFFQPKLSKISQQIFDIPILQNVNDLNTAFKTSYDEYQENSVRYRIVLYVLVFLLLVILRWSFKRLQSTVTMLHVEVQRKIKAEKELEEINRQLEQRVASRTKELTIKNNDLNKALADLEDAQEQLIMQEKMASVGMLTTGIAHEIKNPLNFVNNFSDISVDLVQELSDELAPLKEKLDQEQLSYVQEIIQDLKTNCEKIKEHGSRADNIVKNMLQHSQVSGLQKEAIDLKNMMEDNINITLDKYEVKDKHPEINIVKNYDPDLNKVVCVPQAIARVLIYILDNALYAILEKSKKNSQPDYTPEMSVSIQQKDANVVIKIRDNGIGIPEKQLDKIFEPFFTTKPTGTGNTGLGLSICYDIVVKQHKGELTVQSEEQRFTEFTIMLPVNA